MNANPRNVATTAMAVLNVLQDRDINDQIQATACLFVLFNKLYDLTPTEVLTAAANLMEDAEAIRPEFRAALDYMTYEW